MFEKPVFFDSELGFDAAVEPNCAPKFDPAAVAVPSELDEESDPNALLGDWESREFCVPNAVVGASAETPNVGFEAPEETELAVVPNALEIPEDPNDEVPKECSGGMSLEDLALPLEERDVPNAEGEGCDGLATETCPKVEVNAANDDELEDTPKALDGALLDDEARPKLGDAADEGVDA